MSDEGARWIGAATYAKKDEVRRQELRTSQSRLAAARRVARNGFGLIRVASERCCSSLPTHKILGTGKKIMFLVRKGDVPECESHSYDLFSVPEEFLGVGSFARLPCTSLVRTTSFTLHEYSPPRTRRPYEEFLRQVLPESFRLAPEALLRSSSEKSLISVSHEKGGPSE
jgi:hypothetical protein